MPSAQDLITTAHRRLIGDMPALAKLKLVIRLELRGRGDVQVFRVATPGPDVRKADPDDARIELAMARADFNRLAAEGTLAEWREAYERGAIKAGGDPDVIKLIGTVIAKHQARARLKKVR